MHFPLSLSSVILHNLHFFPFSCLCLCLFMIFFFSCCQKCLSWKFFSSPFFQFFGRFLPFFSGNTRSRDMVEREVTNLLDFGFNVSLFFFLLLVRRSMLFCHIIMHSYVGRRGEERIDKEMWNVCGKPSWVENGILLLFVWMEGGWREGWYGDIKHNKISSYFNDWI